MPSKMQQYYEDFAKENIGSIEHLNSFCANPETIQKFSADELAELMNLWTGGQKERVQMTPPAVPVEVEAPVVEPVMLDANEEIDAILEAASPEPTPEAEMDAVAELVDALPEVDDTWSDEEVEAMNYASMTKDQIEEAIIERHGVDVDKRLKKETLIEQAVELDNSN